MEKLSITERYLPDEEKFSQLKSLWDSINEKVFSIDKEFFIFHKEVVDLVNSLKDRDINVSQYYFFHIIAGSTVPEEDKDMLISDDTPDRDFENFILDMENKYLN
jgi:hypothetical protein